MAYISDLSIGLSIAIGVMVLLTIATVTITSCRSRRDAHARCIAEDAEAAASKLRCHFGAGPEYELQTRNPFDDPVVTELEPVQEVARPVPAYRKWLGKVGTRDPFADRNVTSAVVFTTAPAQLREAIRAAAESVRQAEGIELSQTLTDGGPTGTEQAPAAAAATTMSSSYSHAAPPRRAPSLASSHYSFTPSVSPSQAAVPVSHFYTRDLPTSPYHYELDSTEIPHAAHEIHPALTSRISDIVNEQPFVKPNSSLAVFPLRNSRRLSPLTIDNSSFSDPANAYPAPTHPARKPSRASRHTKSKLVSPFPSIPLACPPTRIGRQHASQVPESQPRARIPAARPLRQVDRIPRALSQRSDVGKGSEERGRPREVTGEAGRDREMRRRRG